MDFPTPRDPMHAPIWESYVIAQASQASLRLIPTHAHALGVEVDGARVVLVLQAAAHSPASEEDLSDIVTDLEGLLGPDVSVSHRMDIRGECSLSPHDGVHWFFAARA